MSTQPQFCGMVKKSQPALADKFKIILSKSERI